MHCARLGLLDDRAKELFGRTDEANALALLRSHRDKSYSLYDALGFVVMKRLRITTAIVFESSAARERRSVCSATWELAG